MKLVVGLGNPGDKYKNNRHNAGFIILDAFAELHGAEWSSNKKISSKVAVLKNLRLVLVKPETFMNASGKAVSKALNYFGIQATNLLLVHDDVDLKLLQFKISFDSSSAGHHGVQNVISELKTQNFARLRVGVGRPAENSHNVVDYVLDDFSSEELESIKKLGIEHLLSSLKV